eukprot:841998-Rhodomonas_salina.1
MSRWVPTFSLAVMNHGGGLHSTGSGMSSCGDTIHGNGGAVHVGATEVVVVHSEMSPAGTHCPDATSRESFTTRCDLHGEAMLAWECNTAQLPPSPPCPPRDGNSTSMHKRAREIEDRISSQQAHR